MIHTDIQKMTTLSTLANLLTHKILLNKNKCHTLYHLHRHGIELVFDNYVVKLDMRHDYVNVDRLLITYHGVRTFVIYEVSYAHFNDIIADENLYKTMLSYQCTAVDF